MHIAASRPFTFRLALLRSFRPRPPADSFFLQTTRCEFLSSRAISILFIPSVADARRCFVATARALRLLHFRSPRSVAGSGNTIIPKILQSSLRPPVSRATIAERKSDIGFPRATSEIVSRPPILIPRHFPRRHICISVNLDAGGGRELSPEQFKTTCGLAGCINLRDRARSLALRSFFLCVSLRAARSFLPLFLSALHLRCSCGTITTNPRMRILTIHRSRGKYYRDDLVAINHLRI